VEIAARYGRRGADELNFPRHHGSSKRDIILQSRAVGKSVHSAYVGAAQVDDVRRLLNAGPTSLDQHVRGAESQLS